MDRLVAAAPRRVASIGLTGGIGSGKSTVAALLVAHGAQLVDTDVIARALTVSGGAAMPMLLREFGSDAVTADGALDRDRMRTLVFADAGAKARLEAILHPLIGAEALRQAAAAETRTVVFDVPLLTESGHWRGRVERVLVVDCSTQTQLERVCQRAGWSEAAARGAIAQQTGRAPRRAVADAVLFNDGVGLAQLAAEVSTLWALWCPQQAPRDAVA